MSKPKLTDWFPPEVKPVHVGVYKTNASVGTYQKWNGKYWCAFCATVDRAAHCENSNKSLVQHVRWRGLAVKP